MKKAKDSSLASLMQAARKNNGYMFPVSSIKKVHGIVYIGLKDPERTAKMTQQAYDKVKDYIVVDKKKAV